MRHDTQQSGVSAQTRRFSGSIQGMAKEPIRPPWSWNEQDFVAACTRCDACIGACPNGIIVRSVDGFPEVDFIRGECTFCADCVTACKPGALVRAHAGSTPWLVKASITRSCLARNKTSCTACAGSCSRGAVRFASRGGASIPEIDKRACNGCGACIGFCPESAIGMTAPAKPRSRTIAIPLKP